MGGENPQIRGEATADAAIPWDTGRKTAAPKINETMVLDTKVRREMIQQAAAMGERAQFSAGRMKVATLVILRGNIDTKEFTLTNKLTVIGKSPLAPVQLKGWIKPTINAHII